MNEEISNALELVNKKLKELEAEWSEKSSEVGRLENKRDELIREINTLNQEIEEKERERIDVQSLTDAKNKENRLKAIAIKQAQENVTRREEIVDKREKDLDMREVRIKDREVMYRIDKNG